MVEAACPFELEQPYADVFWTNLADRRIEYVFFFAPNNTRTAAQVFGAVLNAACSKMGKTDEGKSILADARVIEALARMRVVFVSRAIPMPFYIRHAGHYLSAEGFVHDVQESRALPVSRRCVAHSQAREMTAELPDDRRCVQLGKSAAHSISILNDFISDLHAESAGTKWAAWINEVLEFLMPARKPAASAGHPRLWRGRRALGERVAREGLRSRPGEED